VRGSAVDDHADFPWELEKALNRVKTLRDVEISGAEDELGPD